MKIINLVENTPGIGGCGVEHGLSFYIETENHKILCDTGASDLMLQNAEKLGVDLKEVETVVLSHGHYDHGGGIPSFLKINTKAKIYMQESALGDYYTEEDDDYRYVGLPEELRGNPRIELISGNYRIHEDLCILGGFTENRYKVPETNVLLKEKTEKGYIQDEFRHEQCLIVSLGSRKILFSGCAHHGIRNVMEYYRDYAGSDPDVVISGFHMMRGGNLFSEEDIEEITATALELKNHKTIFYTGHCTGEKPYEIMKEIMGDQLNYVHCGEQILLG